MNLANPHCFTSRGGAGQLTDAMAAALTKKPTYDKVVNYIGLSRTIMIKNGKLEKKTVVRLKVEGEKAKSTGGGSPKEAVREYGHVISSIPFPCLRSVDTTQCGFDWNTQSAIRMLNYEPSVKVAIRFSDRWWEQAGPNNTPHDGGISRTDGPARIIVYPSYGRKEDNGATMIVSYTWAQDADRLGSLARGRDTDAEIRLLRLIVKDLADIHQLDFDELWKKKLDHHIVNWSADPYAGGKNYSLTTNSTSDLRCHFDVQERLLTLVQQNSRPFILLLLDRSAEFFTLQEKQLVFTMRK